MSYIGSVPSTTFHSETNTFTGDIKLEGATANDFETSLSVVDPTADRTITLPDATGTVLLNSGNQSITGDLTVDEVFLANTTDHKIGKANFGFGDGIALTTDSGSVIIGQGNASFTHYFNVNDVPHWFNKTIYTNGDFMLYSDTGALIWENNRGTDHEVTLTTTTPSDARTITLPDATGTVALATPYINASTLLSTNSDLSGIANPTFSSSLITDDYDYYDVYLHDVKPTSNASNSSNYIWCRFKQNNSEVTGTKYMSRGYHIGMKRGDTWESAAWAYSNQYQIYLTYPNADVALAPDSEGTFNAHYRFYNLRSTTTYKGVREIDGQYFSNDNNYGHPGYYHPFGFLDDGTSTSYDTKVDGIIFGIGYGSPFTAGSMRLYGWKK